MQATKDDAALRGEFMTKSQLAKIFIKGDYDTVFALRPFKDSRILHAGGINSDPDNVMALLFERLDQISGAIFIS